MTERIKTGIIGFDDLVGGGLPVGKHILLTGTPGTGKTILALNYLYAGAVTQSQAGLYVSFEEHCDSLRAQAKQFGWDFESLEDKKLIFFLNIPRQEITDNTIPEIVQFALKNHIKRLVIDSATALAINTPTTHARVVDVTNLYIQRFMYGFFDQLRKLVQTTSLIISQTTEGHLSSDGASEFICDGIILITHESLGGDYSRTLQIRKMREVKHDEDPHPLEISKKGIIIRTAGE